MSAETLRRAAALMRERAEAATPGPWGFGGAGVGTDYWDGRDEYPIARTDFTPERGLSREWMDRNKNNGEHIASWHPAVALAVADLLSDLAIDYEDGAIDGATHDSALAVARVYLGEQP